MLLECESNAPDTRPVLTARLDVPSRRVVCQGLNAVDVFISMTERRMIAMGVLVRGLVPDL